MPGSVTLLGGEPGIGKSTLLLQALAGLAKDGHRCLYVTAEESVQQVRLRAERLGALPPNLWLVAEVALPHVLDHLGSVAPDVVVVDSIQAIYEPSLSSAPGSVAQVRECAHRLVRASKERALATVLVGHVTKDGGLAGPRVLEHLVDTVLSFEGERHHALRMLRAVKHRFGSTDELGLFEMTDAGLDGVPDPSALFLADRRPGTAGLGGGAGARRPPAAARRGAGAGEQVPPGHATAIGPGARQRAPRPRGRRAPAARGPPHFQELDIHTVVAGGVKTVEPGADLGVALALVSARTGMAATDDLVACGEVGLGGELRQVRQTARRLAEAARLGFRRAVVPASAPADVPGIELLRAATLAEAVELARVRPPAPTSIHRRRPGRPTAGALLPAGGGGAPTSIGRWPPAAAPSSSPLSASWPRGHPCGPGSTASSRPRWAR